MERKEPNANDLRLELVQVIFRHGARTPIPEELCVYQFNDTSAYEPLGLGQLTKDGKKMEYDFGVFLKDRYKNFLSKSFESDEVYAYSTDTHRTKVSLQLVLAGLYPPVGHDIWNPNLIWSPIPYTHVPLDLDILFLYFDRLSYKKLRTQAYESEEFKKKIEGFSDFLAFLTVKTKVNFDNIYDVVSIHGIISVDQSLNLPLPDWYKPDVRENFRKLLSLIWDGWTFTLELKKLCGGPLIKTLINNMNLEGTYKNPRKLYLYSGHDANIAILLRSHNIEEPIILEYGCGLILEKLRDSNDQVYVRLLYWSGSGSLTPLKLGNYKEFCPIDEYLKIVEPIIPSESEIDAMLEYVNIEKLRNALYYESVI